jgi:hypothetical protein
MGHFQGTGLVSLCCIIKNQTILALPSTKRDSHPVSHTATSGFFFIDG